MRDFDRIKERLEDAADYAERLLKLLQRMQRKVEAAPELYQQNEAERGLRLGVDVLAALQDILAAGCIPRPDDAEQAYNPQRALCVDVCYESPHILRCTMPALPVTKTRAAAHGYTALCSQELWEKISTQKPAGFQPYTCAYVIYVHYDVADTRLAAYYDNDNLAIKALLDTVLPVVCLDDAAPLCDNLYFYVDGPDQQPHTELWVVEHDHLAQWAALHPELPMLADLRPFYQKATFTNATAAQIKRIGQSLWRRPHKRGMTDPRTSEE